MTVDRIHRPSWTRTSGIDMPEGLSNEHFLDWLDTCDPDANFGQPVRGRLLKLLRNNMMAVGDYWDIPELKNKIAIARQQMLFDVRTRLE